MLLFFIEDTEDHPRYAFNTHTPRRRRRRRRGDACSIMSDSFYDLMDCSPQGSSFHGIFQARILECVAISFFKGNPGFKPVSPALQADSLPSEPPGKPF